MMVHFDQGFQQRVFSEALDLEGKTLALGKLVVSDTFNHLPEHERTVMSSQLCFMRERLSMLRERIGLWVCRSVRGDGLF